VVIAEFIGATPLGWIVLALLGWQFVHFQKQNLGLAALAASAHGASSLTSDERNALVGAGLAATLAIIARPDLVGLPIFDDLDAIVLTAALAFAGATIVGVRSLMTRPCDERPVAFAAMYLTGFAFWLPVFVFRSPFAAVGGLVIAHGLQYLLLVALISPGRAPVAVAFVAAIALSAVSHLHGTGTPTVWLYGLFLGATASHFVVDAGLWRLRDPFPRRFLASRLPYLVRAIDRSPI
jgi:hypothetical protein